MFILNPRLAADIFDDEYIIANLDTGLYYSIQGNAVSLIQALPFNDPQEPIKKISNSVLPAGNNVENELASLWQKVLEENIVINNPSFPGPENTVWEPAVVYVPPRYNRYADMQDLLMLDPIHDVDEEGWPVKKDQ